MQTEPCKFSSRTLRLEVSKKIKLGLTALYKALFKMWLESWSGALESGRVSSKPE